MNASLSLQESKANALDKERGAGLISKGIMLCSISDTTLPHKKKKTKPKQNKKAFWKKSATGVYKKRSSQFFSLLLSISRLKSSHEKVYRWVENKTNGNKSKYHKYYCKITQMQVRN